ncbi:hypothetical protein MAM1_0331c09755 [Mucor ambiguus]|uniref:Uncharacterized protein n=1 Tax=Mucor ambiguus TaxID=91626 RepID=A0A0C9N2G3_9FUNG|nr:hypothetical protein MAM1_0331c09755 [Mucor ambiguus]
MSSQENNTPIDNELFRSYSQYKFCKIEKTKCFTEPEKAAIITILKNCLLVDGNLVRSIMNEAFESSCLPVDKKADAVHDGPSNGTKNSANSMSNVIDLTQGGENISNSSPELTYSEIAHVISSSSEEPNGGISDFDSDDLISDNGSFSCKRKHASLQKPKEKKGAKDAAIQGLLSNESLIRLYILHGMTFLYKLTLLLHLMKAVNASFDVQTPFSKDIFSYGNTEIFNINRHFERKSRLNQSQEHLSAYKIGKLIQRDRRLFSPDIVYRNIKRYYQGLIKKLKFYSRSQKQDFAFFSKYCERVVHLVENTGLYAIFIPEILPPYRIKITSSENFEKIENYLNQRCSCFKDIAHFDNDGRLKIEDSRDVGQSSSSISQSLNHI